MRQTKNPYLRLISGGQIITISACKGGKKANIYNAKKTFSGYMDFNFRDCGINLPQPATKKIEVDVHKIYDRGGNLKTLIGSLCPNLVKEYSYDNLGDVPVKELKTSLKENNLIFKSQEQIEKFAQENEQWLRDDGYGTFFLFAETIDGEEEFFVALVYIDFAELGVIMFDFLDTNCLNASDSHYFVVPTTKHLESKN